MEKTDRINEAMLQLKKTNYPNVKYDQDNTKNDQVNSGLLEDLQKAASSVGLVVTITTARTGHSKLTKSKKVSRHMNGTGVDISIIDGIGSNGANGPTNGNPQFREKGNKLAAALESMGYKRNVESGNPKAVLWQTNTGGNHFNHLHVSNTVGATELDPSVSDTPSTETPSTETPSTETGSSQGFNRESLRKTLPSSVNPDFEKIFTSQINQELGESTNKLNEEINRIKKLM